MYSAVLFEMVSRDIVAERLANAERERVANAAREQRSTGWTLSGNRLHLLLRPSLRTLASRTSAQVSWKTRRRESARPAYAPDGRA